MAFPYAGGRIYPAPSSEATMGDLGRSLLRSWKWIAVPTLAAFLCSLAFVVLVSPRYTGEAKLILQTSDSYFTRPGSERTMEQAPQIDEQAVASQVQVVMSRDLAREAIRRLDLVGNPEFDPSTGGVGLLQRLASLVGLGRTLADRPPEDRVLEKYYDNLLVYPVGKSRIVAIEFRSRDPELAARAANTIAELYLGQQDDTKKDQARSASTWLGTNIDALRKRVADSEAKVEAFRAKTGLLVGSGTATLSAQQLSDLSTQLGQAQSARSDAQAKARLIRDAIRDGRTFDIPDVNNNELIRRLLEQRITLRAQLALESRTLLPQHPRIKELNAQLQDLEQQLKLAAERTVRTLENDARIAGARVESIEAAIEQQKKVVGQANENEVQLRALEREARTQREQLETYLTRYREATARDVDSGAPPDARIVSRAIAPQTPSFPRKLPIVALSTLAVLILSAGSIVARELLAARPAGEAEAGYAYGPAGELRFAGEAKRDFAFDLSHLDRGPIVDAQATDAIDVPPAEIDPRYDFGALAARLAREASGGRGRRILVTGLAGREETMQVARGLALTVARRSRAVLIEADADEVTPVDAVPGFTDLVAGEASFAEAIGGEPGSRLHRVATGTLMNEALTGSPDGVDVALQAFERTYDWVIVALIGDDSGALTSLFAGRVDSAVLASSLAPTSPDLVGAYERLQAAGVKDVVVAREQALDMDVAA